MKTFKYLCLFVFLFCFILNAQIIRAFGPKISYGNSRLDTDFFPELFSSRSSFNLGFSAEFFPSDFFSMNLEIDYVQKGFTEKTIETNAEGQKIKDVIATSKLSYISIPLLAKFRYQNNISPYISLGPRLDFLVAKQNGVYNFSSVSVKSEMLNFYNDFTYGASAAIGTEITDLIPAVITIEARYNLDFNDSSNNNNFELKNKSFDIWLGLLL